MTFKQVHIAFTTIIKRRNEEMKFQARCLGAEIKEDTTESGTILTEEEKEKFHQMAVRSLMARKAGNGRDSNTN